MARTDPGPALRQITVGGLREFLARVPHSDDPVYTLHAESGWPRFLRRIVVERNGAVELMFRPLEQLAQPEMRVRELAEQLEPCRHGAPIYTLMRSEQATLDTVRLYSVTFHRTWWLEDEDRPPDGLEMIF